MPRKPDASWEMKVAIWDLAAKQGERPEVILRDLVRLWAKGERLEEVPDPRTISKIIGDFQSLPVNVLKTLPRHTWSLRKDLEDIRGQLEEPAPGKPVIRLLAYDGTNPQYRGPFTDSTRRTAFYVRVAAVAKGQKARSCWAKLNLLPPGDTLAHKVGEFELHPFGDEKPYFTPQVSAEKVDIVPGLPQYFDVAFSAVGAPADSYITSGRVVALAGPQTGPEGCWIATPIALFSRPTVDHHAHLPPGHYKVGVTVGDENGQAESADFTLISPARGQELGLRAP